jgi:hypothetical protein
MTIEFEYPKKFTFSQIKTKTKSEKPVVRGIKNYLFRLKNNFEGISINPSDGIITINKKAVAGNYILEIDCIDSVSNKSNKTSKHIIFVRDPNVPFPGDDEFSSSEDEDNNAKHQHQHQNQHQQQKENIKNKKVKNDKKKVMNENFFEKLKNRIFSNNNSAVVAVVTFAFSAITLLSD